jgi:hypothetical protein
VAENPVPPAQDPHKESPLPKPCFGKIQYLYLLRVPILVGLTIFFLPIVSLYCFRQLLGNLFVVMPSNIFWTLIATEMLVFGILVVTRVVLLNGLERFRIPQGLSEDVIKARWLLATQLLLLPMFVALIFSNDQADGTHCFWRLLAGGAAILVAFIAGFLVLLASVLISQRYRDDKKIAPHDRFPLPFKFMEKWIDCAYNKNLNFPKIKDWFKSTIPTWPDSLKNGYFDQKTWLPYPGQLLTFSMLLLSSGLYELIGYLKHQHFGIRFEVPAIAYVVVLLLVLTWLLSIAAFFFDYYRFPLLFCALLFVLSTNSVVVSDHISFALQPIFKAVFFPVAIFLIVSFCSVTLHGFRRKSLIAALVLLFAANLISNTDHFYQVRPHAGATEITPYDVVTAESRVDRTSDHPNGRITVVATAGGGIQAAAWTAQVLTGLQQEIPGDSPRHSFANSIAAISSVSGGAVGTMFFASRYRAIGAEPGFPSVANPSEIVDDAEFPALGNVAWAMVYPDLTRALLPFLKWNSQRLVDRGWALEQTWRIRGRGHLDSTLDDWRSGVKEGSRPALIFNSTLVESGEPYLLATADFNKQQKIEGVGRETFQRLLPGYDIPIVTAVRLAASFPFVTPASRPLSLEMNPDLAGNDATTLNNARYHAVDGGYYDNYGVNSLLEFLHEALTTAESNQVKAPDILIILIRSFPSEGAPLGKSRGWFYQFWAPISALLEVRETGQLVRDREAINLFIDYWKCRGVKVVPATFEFPGENAPLSWQMNSAQITEVETEWKKRQGPENPDWLQVSCFFHPEGKGCDSPELTQKQAW